MDEKTIQELFDQLKRGERSEVRIKKEDFLNVRKVIVNRPDFKHLRGIAQRGGDVIYEYLKEPRS